MIEGNYDNINNSNRPRSSRRKTDNHKWSIKVVETYKLSDGTIKEKTAAELRIKWKRNGWFYKLKWNILGDKDLLQQHVDIEKVVEKIPSEIICS